MRVLKLDIARQTGWAVMDKINEINDIIFYNTKEFWHQRYVLTPGSKAMSMFNFIKELIKEYKPDEIWMEQLNSMRNAKTVRSLLQQQSGAHMAAEDSGIVIKEIATRSSYRKQEAVRKVEQLFPALQLSSVDEADAIMLNEKGVL